MYLCTYLRLRLGRARKYVAVHRALAGEVSAAHGAGGSHPLPEEQRAHLETLDSVLVACPPEILDTAAGRLELLETQQEIQLSVREVFTEFYGFRNVGLTPRKARMKTSRTLQQRGLHCGQDWTSSVALPGIASDGKRLHCRLIDFWYAARHFGTLTTSTSLGWLENMLLLLLDATTGAGRQEGRGMTAMSFSRIAVSAWQEHDQSLGVRGCLENDLSTKNKPLGVQHLNIQLSLRKGCPEKKGRRPRPARYR